MILGESKKVGKLNGKRNEQYQEFCSMIESLGFWNIDETAWSEKTGLPTSTVSRWKQKWLREDWVFDLNQMKKILDSTGKSALKKLQLLAHSKDNEIARKASRDVLKGMRDYIEVCKGTGLIEEQADPNAQVLIQATDKDLYNILTPKQRKDLLKLNRE